MLDEGTVPSRAIRKNTSVRRAPLCRSRRPVSIRVVMTPTKLWTTTRVLTTPSQCTIVNMLSKRRLYLKLVGVRRPFWVAAVGLIGTVADAAHAQRDSAIILAVPSIASAAKCSTSVAPHTGVVSITLAIWPRPLADSRLVLGTFDATGRPLTLRDVGYHLRTATIESATVQFDSTGAASGGLGQHLTPDDFSKDSTGALHAREGRGGFTPLTRAQLAKAESVSAWLWRRECRSAKRPSSENR